MGFFRIVFFIKTLDTDCQISPNSYMVFIMIITAFLALLAWSFIFLSLMAWMLPEMGLGLLLPLTLLISPFAWAACGISGYWLAVAFDRMTGLGFMLPSGPLAKRNINLQAIMGPTLLLDIMLSMPITWYFGKNEGFWVSPVGKSEEGVIVSGAPSGKDDGWYRFKVVWGVSTYKEARSIKNEGRWYRLSDIEPK